MKARVKRRFRLFRRKGHKGDDDDDEAAGNGKEGGNRERGMDHDETDEERVYRWLQARDDQFAIGNPLHRHFVFHSALTSCLRHRIFPFA